MDLGFHLAQPLAAACRRRSLLLGLRNVRVRLRHRGVDCEDPGPKGENED